MIINTVVNYEHSPLVHGNTRTTTRVAERQADDSESDVNKYNVTTANEEAGRLKTSVQNYDVI